MSKLFAWGLNDEGQLGDNTKTNKHTPTQVGTSDWTAIACGIDHSLGIKLVEVLPSSNFFLFFN